MTDAITVPSAPSSILLATDLSCRCDRALDRAVLAARRWKSRLVVLTVIDPADAAAARRRYADLPSWWQLPNLQSVTERRLRAEVPADVPTSVRVVEGAVADMISQVATEEGCGLVVTGIARDETFGRMVLGSTVDGLIRRAATPVLVVRTRPRTPYQRVTVAADFSAASCHALRAAAGLMGGAELSLFHAFDAPYAGMASVDRSAMIEAQRATAARDCEAFLDGCPLPDGVRRALRPVLDYGAPSELLNAYVTDTGVDLIVLGSHRRSRLFEVVVGSVARRILEEAAADTLVVSEPPVPGA